MDYLLSSAQKYNLKFQRILSKFNNTFLYFQEIHFQNLIMGLLEIIPSASAAKKILFQSLLHTEKGKMRLKIHPGFLAASQLYRTAQYCDLVTHSHSQWLSDNFRLYDYNDYNDYNNYNDYRDRDRDRDIESDFVNKWQLTITDKLRNLNHDI